MYVHSMAGRAYCGPRSRSCPCVSVLARQQTRRGFGALPPQAQAIATAASAGAATTASILVAMGAIGGPVGAAIAGLAAAGVAIANIFSGCGQSCVAATAIVNQVEPVLVQNVTAYCNSPVRTVSMRAAALNNFDTVWAAVVRNCSAIPGAAGQNCISTRQAGACHYQTSPGGWQNVSGVWQYVPAGPSGSGSTCWNWFVGYRDPIANDPGVQSDSAAAAVSGGLLSAVGINPSARVLGVPISSVAIPAALLLGLLLLADGDK